MTNRVSRSGQGQQNFFQYSKRVTVGSGQSWSRQSGVNLAADSELQTVFVIWKTITTAMKFVVAILLMPLMATAQDVSPAELRLFQVKDRFASLLYKNRRRCIHTNRNVNCRGIGTIIDYRVFLYPAKWPVSMMPVKMHMPVFAHWIKKASVFYEKRPGECSPLLATGIADRTGRKFWFRMNCIACVLPWIIFVFSRGLSGGYEIVYRRIGVVGKLGDRNRMAHFNNVIGYIHMKQGNLIEARSLLLPVFRSCKKNTRQHVWSACVVQSCRSRHCAATIRHGDHRIFSNRQLHYIGYWIARRGISLFHCRNGKPISQ